MQPNMTTEPADAAPPSSRIQLDVRDRALALIEQACARSDAMTTEELRLWQARMGLSGRGAARLLGTSVNTYIDRVNGTCHSNGRPVVVSRTLSLACAALEAARLLAHSRDA